MKKYILLSALSLALFVVSCDNEEGSNYQHEQLNNELTGLLDGIAGGNGVDKFKLPSPGDYSNLPQDENNPVTTEKIHLGKLLFHETALGIHAEEPVALQTYSCASCHFAEAGFQAGCLQGLGDGGTGFGVRGEMRQIRANYNDETVDAQAIRSPTVLNCAYQKTMLWNGQFGAKGANEGTESQWTAGTPKAENALGFEGVEIQAIAAINVHRLGIDNNLIQNTLYKTYFDAAFPNDIAAERYSRKNAGLAIAAYERSILANQAPFQLWLQGDDRAMTLDQKEGAILFFGKAGCANCHNSAALNDENFYALGIKDLYQETQTITFKTNASNIEVMGRGGFTGKAEDNYKFKTPQLYNLKDSPFYGHGGSFRTIEDVIRYKNAAVPDNQVDNLSDFFVSLNLTDEEVRLIAEFIKNGLYDPNLIRYSPSALPSGFCFPNNDPVSRVDRGCN